MGETCTLRHRSPARRLSSGAARSALARKAARSTIGRMQTRLRDPGRTARPKVVASPVATLGLVIARSAAPDEGPDRVIYASDSEMLTAAIERARQGGLNDITVVSIDPFGSSPDEMRSIDPSLGVRHERAGWAAMPDLIRRTTSPMPSADEGPDLLSGLMDRVFHGEHDRYWRFMAVLQSALPIGCAIAIRGSSVEGVRYRDGQAFDAAGPGTSDVDVVVLGDAAMAAWATDAYYLPGVNTWPLDDEHPDVAPSLDPARRAARSLVGRPVAIQAMARWFLDLRSATQGTRYLLVEA